MRGQRCSTKSSVSMDTIARRKDLTQFILRNDDDVSSNAESFSSYSDSEESFSSYSDSEESFSSYSDSDESDASDWDMEMEELEAGVNSMLNARSQVLLTRSAVARSESNMFVSPEEDDGRNEIGMVSNIDEVMNMKPVEFLERILRDMDRNMDVIHPANDSFITVEERNVAAYSQIAPVARQGDLETMKKMHMEGLCLQSCNIHGESIVHIVCRRGNSEMLRFLLREGCISLRVRDDMGRTALHDAAWTSKPNFDLIRMILADCPDLLLVKDKRGHLPLSYVPREQWGSWCSFLSENRYVIHAAVQSKYIDISL